MPMPKYRGVFKRGKYWYAYFYYKGERHTPGHGFETAYQAHLWVVTEKECIRSGLILEKGNMSISQLIDEWLTDYYSHKSNVSADTYKNVEGYLRNGIKSQFGDI